jgi:DNA-binding NarL/FixJ family response regulator
MANIVLVDAHPITRLGIRCLLDQHRILAEGSEAGVVLLIAGEADLVIVDSLLNAAHIAAASTAPLIVCAAGAPPDVPMRVRGFVDKHAAGSTLAAAVDAVLAGGTFGLADVAAAPVHDRLSPREREIMTMILDGRRPKQISFDLDISVKTVSTHRFRLLRKIGVDSDLGLLRYALLHGLA